MLYHCNFSFPTDLKGVEDEKIYLLNIAKAKLRKRHERKMSKSRQDESSNETIPEYLSSKTLPIVPSR